MLVRTTLAACAAVMIVAAPSFAEAPAPACAETNFRIYFSHNATTLDATGTRMLDIAARSVAECPYAELRVAVDASSPQSLARANAITDAANEREWDAVRVVPLQMAQQASHGGPEYAEVVMSPHAVDTPAPPPLVVADIGI